MIQYIMLGLNPSFGPSCLFWSNCLWPWKWGQSHQNLITSFPGPNAGYLCASLVKIHILVYLAFLVDRLQKSPFKLILTVLIVWWPWKLGKGHQNLINSFNYHSDTIHKARFFLALKNMRFWPPLLQMSPKMFERGTYTPPPQIFIFAGTV